MDMRILIITGIFEPEAGGPATYAATLGSKLTQSGVLVTVLTYSILRRYDFDAKYPFRLVRVVRGNRVLNRVRLFFEALRLMRDCDIVYTLDWFAAGLPVALVANMLRKKYIVRVGGDYLWEQICLGSGAEGVSLADFYAKGLYLRSSYRMPLSVIRYVLGGAAHVVFNSKEQLALYDRFYALAPNKTSVIYNAMPRGNFVDIVRGTSTTEFVYWGRLVPMKNVSALVRAFAMARISPSYTLTIIGDGPDWTHLQKLVHDLHIEHRVQMLPGMPQRDALLQVKDARAFVLPSWTDISPNQVFEAMVIGLPVLVTQENYLPIRDQLPEMLDPRSVEDISHKLEMLVDEGKYREFVMRFNRISFEHNWEAVVREHQQLFAQIAGEVS